MLITKETLRSTMAVAMAFGILGAVGCEIDPDGDDALDSDGDDALDSDGDDALDSDGDDALDSDGDEEPSVDRGEGPDAYVDRETVAAYPTGNANLGIVTFNVGPGENQAEYESFRSTLIGTDRILVLQEVEDISGMRNALSADFPYEYITENYTDELWNWSCFCNKRKRNNVVVRSKLPIVHQESHLVQTDPGGDRWRRHAQYVRIKVRDDVNIRLFHYHNTYNWHNDSSQYEKSGMQSFKSWVQSKVGAVSNTTDKVFMVGDFNLTKSVVDDILGTTLTYQSDWVDHIVSTNVSKAAGGVVDASNISDHDMVWAQFNLTSNVGTAENNVVRLYEHSSFNGRVTAFGRGNYPNIGNSRGTWWNDRVSSIIAGGSVRLEAWEHSSYGGTKWCLPTTNSCGISNYNDKITALKVMTR